MLISYKWLKSFFNEEEKFLSAEKIADKLTFGAFEIESVENKNNDTVIDVDVLPNRASDSLSHNGIAREVSTLTGISLKYRPLELSPELSPRLSKELSVNISDTNRCSIYTAALVRGVSVGPSPDWIREKLEAIGQKSINNVVDATNYILFGMGQPLHAFDAKKFTEKGGGIGVGVRPAKKGEKITVLGGDEYKLTEEMTVITDVNSDMAIAIAGVKGGVAMEIDENTTDIIIESAKFNPVVTRKSAQALNLRTDASKRFENEVPKEFPFYGIGLVVELILKIAGGELAGYTGSEIKKSNPYKLGISVDEVNKILGTKFSESDVSVVFDKLGFEYEKVKNPIERVLELAPALVGKPYKYGASVSHDAPDYFDCSSFIAYLFAQSGVSMPRVAIDQFVYGTPVGKEDLRPGDIIFSNDESNEKEVGFTRISDGEQVSNTPSKKETVDFLPGTKVEKAVGHDGIFLGDGRVIHAAGKDSGFSKVVIEKLSESNNFKNIIGYRRMAKKDEKRFVVNVPFERLDLRAPIDLVEEIGRVYGYENIKGKELPKSAKKIEINKKHYYSEKIRDALTSAEFTEVMTYSLTDKGEVELANALASDKDHLRANLSDGVLKSLEQNEKNAPRLGLYDSVNIFEIGNVFTEKGEETHVCIASTKKNDIERVGKIMKDTLGVVLKVENKNGVIEFNLSALLKKLVEPPESYEKIPNVAQGVMFESISQYPFVSRDISFWVPTETSTNEILDFINSKERTFLVRDSAWEFDSYTKGERTSYAFHLIFESKDKTLTDEEVNSTMRKLESDLKKKGWEVR